MRVLGFDADLDVTDRQREEPKSDRLHLDERVSIPLDPEEALRRLMSADPDAETGDKSDRSQGGSDE